MKHRERFAGHSRELKVDASYMPGTHLAGIGAAWSDGFPIGSHVVTAETSSEAEAHAIAYGLEELREWHAGPGSIIVTDTTPDADLMAPLREAAAEHGWLIEQRPRKEVKAAHRLASAAAANFASGLERGASHSLTPLALVSPSSQFSKAERPVPSLQSSYPHPPSSRGLDEETNQPLGKSQGLEGGSQMTAAAAAKKKDGQTRPGMGKLVSHPTRLKILLALRERPASAAELARAFKDDAGTVAYHLKILGEGGAVEQVDERRVKGGTELVYRATDRPLLDNREFSKMSLQERLAFARTSVLYSLADATASLDSATFAKRPDCSVVHHPMHLDEEGWVDLAELCESFYTRVTQIESEVCRRKEPTFPARVILQAFEMPAG